MKPFRFTLQAIFTLREQEEEAAKQAYADALNEAEKAAARLKAMQDEIHACWQNMRTAMAQGTTISTLIHLRSYYVGLQDQEKVFEREFQKARQAAQMALQRMIVATQKREALEKLQQRQRRLYDYNLARSEQNQLDDLAGRAPTLSTLWRQPANSANL